MSLTYAGESAEKDSVPFRIGMIAFGGLIAVIIRPEASNRYTYGPYSSLIQKLPSSFRTMPSESTGIRLPPGPGPPNPSP